MSDEHTFNLNTESIDDDALIKYVESLDEMNEQAFADACEWIPENALRINMDERMCREMINKRLLQARISEMYRKNGITDDLREMYSLLISYSKMLDELTGYRFSRQRGANAGQAKKDERRALYQKLAGDYSNKSDGARNVQNNLKKQCHNLKDHPFNTIRQLLK